MISTTNLAPHCGAFSRALKIDNIKGPLFPGPEGAGNTNGWCINWMSLEQGKGPTVIYIWLFLYLLAFILQSGVYTKYILPMASDSFLEIEITVSVLWPYFAVPCVDLRLGSVVFPDHTHLLL